MNIHDALRLWGSAFDIHKPPISEEEFERVRRFLLASATQSTAKLETATYQQYLQARKDIKHADR